MIEDAVRATYDVVADAYADHFPSTEPEQRVDLAMIDHFAGLLGEPRSVLDAGCGAGRMLPYLAARRCTVHGVDLSPGMVRRARADHPEHPVQVASLTALPFGDARFAGVLSWYSTIHGDDAALARSLAEMRRVVRPGGLVLVAFQAGAGTQDASRGYRRLGFDVTLSRYLRTADEMAAHLRHAGLHERARLVRAATGAEREEQAVLVAEAV